MSLIDKPDNIVFQVHQVPGMDFQQMVTMAVAEVMQGDPAAVQASGVDRKARMNIDQAAEYLDCSKQTLYDYVRLNKDNIPYHKKMRKLHFYRDELDEWIKGGGSILGR